MNTPYTYFGRLSELIQGIPPDSIISRTILATDQFKAVLFGFATGQELSEHTASQPAVLYFVQGEAELTLGADSQTAAAGTWVHMTPRLPHSIRAKTPMIMLLLLLKSG